MDYLADHADTQHTVTIHMDDLAKAVGIDRRHARRCLEWLEARGFLRRTYRIATKTTRNAPKQGHLASEITIAADYRSWRAGV